MSAHKVAISVRCQTSGCSRSASFVVRNTRNAEMGRYCGTHADRLVSQLQADERRAVRPEEPPE